MNLILLKVTMLLWLPINTLHTKCDRVYILLTVNTSHPLLWVMQFSPPFLRPAAHFTPNTQVYKFSPIVCCFVLSVLAAVHFTSV